MLTGAVRPVTRLSRALSRLDPPGPHGRATDVTTLPGAARRFLTHPRPPFLLGTVASLAAVRLARGGLGAADLRLGLAFAAADPFVEWAIHRGVLHVEPRGAVSRACYSSAGFGHEQHHNDPASMDTMFLRPADVLAGGAVALAVATLGSPRASTGALCVGLGVLAYDWSHFLIHTGYRPRSGLYKRMHRTHRLHHYRNERYWLGVTSPVADIVLQTSKARDAVPVSAGARPALSRLRQA